jgi:hypothetical protein
MAEHERTYSQVQGDYMKPVYEQVTMGGSRGGPTQGKLLGYELDPTLLKKIEVPKPPAILAEEKRLGITIDPVWRTWDGPGGDIPYGPPASYVYDRGDNKYVNFDAEGNNIGETTIHAKDIGLPLFLAMAGAPFIAPALGGFFGGSAAAGTLGATEGALTAAEVAGLPSLGAGLGASEAALTAAEVASLPSAGTTLGLDGAGLTSSVGSPAMGGGAGLSSSSGLGAPLGASEGAGLTSSVGSTAMGGGTGLTAAPGISSLPGGSLAAPGAGLVEMGGGTGLTALSGTSSLPGGPLAAPGNAAAGMGGGTGLTASPGTSSLPGGPLTNAGAAAAGNGILDKLKNALTGGTGTGTDLSGALGLMALMAMMNKGGGGTPASTATIPELTATRSQLPYDVDKKGVNPNTPYRPGQGGVSYFSPTTYTPKAAGGGLMSLGGYSDGGRLLQGPGDGVSDSIPAIIGKKQPARLANGEFVIPARIVSELGNGSTDAGAKRLYEMMSRVQNVRRKTKNVAANTKAAKYLPA